MSCISADNMNPCACAIAHAQLTLYSVRCRRHTLLSLSKLIAPCPLLPSSLKDWISTLSYGKRMHIILFSSVTLRVRSISRNGLRYTGVSIPAVLIPDAASCLVYFDISLIANSACLSVNALPCRVVSVTLSKKLTSYLARLTIGFIGYPMKNPVLCSAPEISRLPAMTSRYSSTVL